MATGDEILAWKKECEKQELIERITCPICEWSLEKHPSGIKHCPFCGWQDSLRSKKV